MYELKKFFEYITLLLKYRVGKEFYFIHNAKIKPCKIYKIIFEYYDPGLLSSTSNKYLFTHRMTIVYDSHTKGEVRPADLFISKEAAAESFLDKNDIPKKLIEVLKPKKTNTTVGDLINFLQKIQAEENIGPLYNTITMDIIEAIKERMPSETGKTTNLFWDCECKEKYIHPVEVEECPNCKAQRNLCPDSHIAEIRPENLFESEE